MTLEIPVLLGGPLDGRRVPIERDGMWLTVAGLATDVEDEVHHYMVRQSRMPGAAYTLRFVVWYRLSLVQASALAWDWVVRRALEPPVPIGRSADLRLVTQRGEA